MDMELKNSIMLHINENLFRKGIITETVYSYAKNIIVQRK